MNRVQNPPGEAALEARITSVAEILRRALSAVAQEVGGSTIRPSRLVRELDIDKSLASRLTRGLRADSSFELISLIPSPTGLRIFLEAARRADVDVNLDQEAESAIEQFQNLLDEVPGGRGALEAIIAGSVAEVRDRSERNAKQAVFRAMSYLLGFHCDTITSAFIVQPAANGLTTDAIDLSYRVGIRRLRPSTPVALFSLAFQETPTSADAPRLETLDGAPLTRDATPFLLPEFSSQPMPELTIFENPNHTAFGLSDELTSLHSPIALGSALMVRNPWHRYWTDERREESRTYLLHYPCKTLVRDLFIHEDLYVGALPEIRLEFPSPTGSTTVRPEGPAERLNTLDMSAPIEQLGIGLERVAVPGVANHSRLLAHAFEATGWDPSKFRGYRTRITYPVPMITMGWWIVLPEGPPRS